MGACFKSRGTGGLHLTVAVCEGAWYADEVMSERPNLLFIFADQWRREAAGFAGNSQVRTPAMDRLAEESFQFTHALSGCPVCSPYRASLMTGQYPSTHGVVVNDQAVRGTAMPLGEALRRAGYDTGYIGKWHLTLHERTRFISAEERLGFDFWRAFGCTHDYSHSPYYAGDDPRVRYWEGYDASAQTDEACRYLESRRGESRAFALVLSWGPPHDPYETAPERFRRMYDPDRIRLRPNVPPDAAEQARFQLAGYYAHVSALDACLARLLAALDEARLAGNTILVLTSDHGDMLGSQGLWRKQHPYEESIRVPWLLRWPQGLGCQARQDPIPFDAPDIMPTLLGLCGVDVPPTVQGTDFSSVIRGDGTVSTNGALLACYRPFHEITYATGGRDYRGLRTARYTYCRDHGGPWLLFDNQADPCQLRNLVRDPVHEAVLSVLDSQLDRKLQLVGDTFDTGEDLLNKWDVRRDERGDVYYRGTP